MSRTSRPIIDTRAGSSASPGDSISSSVVRSGSSNTLRVTDSTYPANSFSTTQSCSTCANSSAEWIAEAPSSGNKILPLANFGTWTETDVLALGPGHAANVVAHGRGRSAAGRPVGVGPGTLAVVRRFLGSGGPAEP